MMRTVWMPGDVRTEIHVSGSDLCVLVDEPPPGWRLPPHRHANESETIHVVRGRFDLEVDGRRSFLDAGSKGHVPRGALHSGGNISDEPGRRIVIFTPGGIEGFWLEVGNGGPDGAFDDRAVLEAAKRFGWRFG